MTLLAFSLAASTMLAIDLPASGALVTTVPLGSAANFGVLGSSTVTNTGPTSVDGDVGLWPGTSVTGFPSGVVTPPGVIEAGTPTAHQAQTDLDAAYTEAAGRTIDTDTPSELGGQTLVAGVYGTPAKDALTLTGSLVLDGNNDPSSVFIFQTDTTLTTASASTVTLINGAQECNVFWQIGSSATLGTGTHLAGNILAFTSITLTTGVVLRGRALAHGAAVTMDTNTIAAPTCDLTPPTTTTLPPVTTTSTLPSVTTTTVPPVTTTTTLPPTTTTTSAPPAPITEPPGSARARPGPTAHREPGVPVSIRLTDNGVPAVTGAPQTGGAPLRKPHGLPWLPILFATLLAGAGLSVIPRARRG